MIYGKDYEDSASLLRSYESAWKNLWDKRQ